MVPGSNRSFASVMNITDRKQSSLWTIWQQITMKCLSRWEMWLIFNLIFAENALQNQRRQKSSCESAPISANGSSHRVLFQIASDFFYRHLIVSKLLSEVLHFLKKVKKLFLSLVSPHCLVYVWYVVLSIDDIRCYHLCSRHFLSSLSPGELESFFC